MSGKKRIIVGEITQGKARGKTLKEELARMNEVEKGSSYETSSIKENVKKK